MSGERRTLRQCAAELRSLVQGLLDRGETAWLAGEAPEAGRSVPAPAPARPTLPLPPVPAAPAAGTGPLADLARTVAECQRCALGRSRTQAVFGEGDPGAELVFVGEAPGAEEDRAGRPFVGAAGQLLTKIIASIGLDRERVFICNVLKCRPPGNRNPLPEEIAACREHLQRQLDLLRPKVICALGTFAAQTLLDTQEPIGRLRGKVYDLKGAKLVPTLHPAALLYHPQNKKAVWEDMKRIAELLNLKLPSRAGEG
jgi:uracil-DNA glycosylase